MKKKDKYYYRTAEGRKEQKENERHAMLQEMWEKLKNTNARSTGIPALDKEILEKIGPWQTKITQPAQVKAIEFINNIRKGEVLLDLTKKYYLHHQLYGFDEEKEENIIYWVISLTPTLEVQHWVVLEKSLKFIKTLEKK